MNWKVFFFVYVSNLSNDLINGRKYPFEVYGITSRNRFHSFCYELYEMNNGEIGGSRGRGRGWQPDNQPRELRRPKIVADDTKGKLSCGDTPATFTDRCESGMM